ncbi:MAG TPA: hypothetical protein VM934_06305 [Pyrinomonadaceae bacterium]|jgi:hypothetical protein|nr:hypothetical protein [Pyrinomonadaceae bacterium]
MTNPPDSFSRPAAADIQRLYRAVSQDARYGHYVRIPRRICLCLDYFKVAFSRRTVRERLHSYYLFIGVVDDVIDSGRVEAGKEILQHLDDRTACFGEEARRSSARLVTEVLKCHISPELYPLVRTKLEELYGSVVMERKAQTLDAYVEGRKAVGCLTAEVSYLLIRPLLDGGGDDLCRFLQRVGEVGCLIDSVIDLRADAREGLLGFKPTRRDMLKLAGRTLGEGLKLSLEHPRLFGLFMESIGDDVLDQVRARRTSLVAVRAGGAESGYACERAT